MLQRMIRKLTRGPGTKLKRVNLHLEIATDDPPHGITSVQLAEIATLLLRGQNSPLREVMATGPEDDWEKMRKGVNATPGLVLEDAHGLTVSIRVEKLLTREEAVALGETVMDIVPRAITQASGMHSAHGEHEKTWKHERKEREDN